MLKEILESVDSEITVYHGGNNYATDILPKYMLTDDSNAQEGVGIYFGEQLKTAQIYGPKIVSLTIDKNRFIDAREDALKNISIRTWKKIGQYMFENGDREELYYAVSDWMEVVEPEDLEDWMVDEFIEKAVDGEIRNVQIQLAEIDLDAFVEGWNKYVKNYDGTYQKQGKNGDTFYAVIKTSLIPTKI